MTWTMWYDLQCREEVKLSGFKIVKIKFIKNMSKRRDSTFFFIFLVWKILIVLLFHLFIFFYYLLFLLFIVALICFYVMFLFLKCWFLMILMRKSHKNDRNHDELKRGPTMICVQFFLTLIFTLKEFFEILIIIRLIGYDIWDFRLHLICIHFICTGLKQRKNWYPCKISRCTE